MCKPQKWGALWVYSMFPHVTHRHISLTTDTFNSLVLIPNFQLSYRYSVSQKQPLGFLKTSENLQKNNKKTAFLVYILRVWKLIYSFFLTLETVFFYILNLFPYLYLAFFIFQSRSFAIVWNASFIISSFRTRFISRRNFLKATCHSFPWIS